jgi:thioredoxin 2
VVETEELMSNASRVVKCPSCEKQSRVPEVSLGRPGCGHCQRALPWIIDANDANFADIIVSDLTVLVELWAVWSKPSELVSPIVEQIAIDYAGRIKVVRIDADRTPRVQAAFRMKGPPMLTFMRHGRVLDSIFGAQPDRTVRTRLDGALLQRV